MLISLIIPCKCCNNRNQNILIAKKECFVFLFTKLISFFIGIKHFKGTEQPQPLDTLLNNWQDWAASPFPI